MDKDPGAGRLRTPAVFRPDTAARDTPLRMAAAVVTVWSPDSSSVATYCGEDDAGTEPPGTGAGRQARGGPGCHAAVVQALSRVTIW